MRLTLRTLLSYLDNVLDKAAHDELEQQIQSSEHAGEWVHRTRDVMRRLRLGAPPIDGEGLADDPNTVAEYLDRTLPEQGVAEFERVCLESDVMLAEVASCHHALAMFLNEAPEIDPDSRRRLHRLQSDLSQALSSRPAEAPVPPHLQDTAPAAEPPVPAPASPAAPAAEVPEYLRSQQRSEWVRWAPAIAALLLLVLTSFIAFGPGGPLAQQDEPVAQNEETPSDPPGDEAVTPEPDEASNDPEESAEVDPQEDPAEPPAPSEEPAAEEPPAVEAEPAPEEAPPTPTEVEEPVEEAAEARPPEEEPEPVEPAEVTPDGLPVVDPPRYQGEESGLAVVAVDPSAWRRLTPGEEFGETSRVVVLPTSRVTIGLAEAFRAILVGPAELVIDQDPSGTPKLDLRYGRLLLANDAAGDNPATAVVTIDGLPHNATLSGGGALALEVERFFGAGWPVLETAAPVSAVANTLSGVIEWSTRGEEIRISKPKRWIVAESPEFSMPEGFGSADWVERGPAGEVVRRASAEIASAITPDRPVWPQLQEIASEDPFRENRALAAACNAALGHPGTLVESFRIKKAADDWQANLAQLRQTASRSPEAAAAVAASFVEQYGPQKAEELLDLLVGFTPEEFGRTPEGVASGVAVETLLPALVSDDLATRVLGSLVLKELAEPYEPAFRPLASSRRRIAAVRRLEALIEDAKLVPRNR